MAYPIPKWWQRVPWHLVLPAGAFVGFLVWLIFFAVRLAQAGGPAVVTWDQGADCGSITGWELASAPVTAAAPNPAPPTGGVSIPNSGSPFCGLAMSRTVTTTGVGPTRFWLRAVAGPTKSTESNSADAALPLAKPAGLTVSVP
jgi:hypothetical protein